MIELNQVINADCLDIMKSIPDKFFELAIVDPPYSDEYSSMERLMMNMKGRKADAGKYHNLKMLPPNEMTWNEILRVSKNQIIWGINWYKRYFGVGRVVWNKDNEGSNFSDCELAYQSFNNKTELVKIRWNGMLQQDMKNKEIRIHPYQKPVQLYKWLLHNYAKVGDKILDTHAGSCSSIIACIDMGFEYLAIEEDKDYYEASLKRLAKENIKIKLAI